MKKTCVVIGDPINHTLSPLIHTAGYRELGIDDKYEYLAKKVSAQEVEKFVREARKQKLRGISCTIPNKEVVIPHLDEIDETAQKIGAVNSVVNQSGVLHGYNTDWIGAMKALSSKAELKNKDVAVLGAGGTAKALIFGLKQAGARVVIYNRSFDKAKALSVQFGCEFRSLKEMTDFSKTDIICNATPVGLKDPNRSPVPENLILPRHIVLDAVYSPYMTKLLSDAEKKGARIIHGTEMLIEQAYAQFKLFTGRDAPKEAMKNALLKALK